MKHIVNIGLILLISANVSGQQLTSSSFYDMQGSLHNPSMAGVNKHGMVGGSFRSMWSGVPGGPETQFLFGSFYLPNINSGLGAYLYNDVTGPTKRIGAQLAYAYQIQLKNEASFSLGIEARLQQFSFDQAKLQQALGSNDPVLGSTDTQFKADAGFGINYTAKKLQVGASVSQLVQSKLDFYSGSYNRTEEGKLYRHYYLHANYKWRTDANTEVIPNFLFIYLPNSPLEFQGGVRVEHKEQFFWGVGFRAHQSWMLSAGVHIKKKFTVGYSFDIFTTPLSTYDKGGNAHEVMLRYDFLK
ncbi:MAG: type IX secretion system membrane protein PorP/SprF [Bacteroidetes bacterium]|nr:MAG: type IX secretion system membrane protein PorP/SprF [Bacteroidota bacterium]